MDKQTVTWMLILAKQEDGSAKNIYTKTEWIAQQKAKITHTIDLLRKNPKDLQFPNEIQNLIQRSDGGFKRLTSVTPIFFTKGH